MQGPDYLRIGDAERDAMTESLHEHFAQGRLTAEELDERLAATLTARTIGDLKVIDRDLPRAHPEPVAPRWPVRGPGLRGHMLLRFVLLALIIGAIASSPVLHVVILVGLFAILFKGLRVRRHLRRHGPPPWAHGEWQGPWQGRPNWHH